jgi:hypothetical protein
MRVHGRSLGRIAAPAIMAARILTPAAVKLWGELRGRVRGTRTSADVDAGMLHLVLSVPLARGGIHTQPLDIKPVSVFYTLTETSCVDCMDALQRSVVSEIMHWSSSAVLDWDRLLAAGGALHFAGAIPQAAVFLYVTAVIRSIGDELRDSGRW